MNSKLFSKNYSLLFPNKHCILEILKDFYKILLKIMLKSKLQEILTKINCKFSAFYIQFIQSLNQKEKQKIFIAMNFFNSKHVLKIFKLFHFKESTSRGQLNESQSRLYDFQLLEAIKQRRLSVGIIDRKSLTRPFIRLKLFMQHSAGQRFCIAVAFKCALYKNNYARPQLADVRFHVYATRNH